MSSPIFSSSPSSGIGDIRHRSASFGGPRLDLVLRPSYALGPFKLGHSLWHVLNYLRSHQSLFPQINITYDESTPRLSPIVIVIQPNLHLVFNGVTQRLNMITLENLDSANGSQSTSHTATSIASAEPSHRPVNLIYNGKLIFSRGSARSPPVALNRSTLHQILGPTYPGHPQSSSVSSESLVAAALGSKADGSDKDRKELVISYPGLAFCFAVKSNGAKEADVDKFQPVSSMHVFSGSELNHPDDILVSPSVATPSSSETPRPAARSSKGTLSPTAAVSDYQQLNSERDRAALDIDAIQVRCPTLLEASITPGRGVSLHFAKSGISRATSPPLDRSKTVTSPHGHAVHAVELLLGITTPQDALCDLGQPQRIFYKEDDRMRIHGAPAGHGGGRGARQGASETSNATDDSAFGSGDHDDSAFFYNYFDLGIDLLFSKDTSRMPSIAEAYDAAASGQPRLEKVVCHTNVPGDALFQRYNRCPWRVASSSTSSEIPAANGGKGTSKSKASKAAMEAFTFEDHFDSTLSAGQDDRGMELDRGTCAEFKGSVASAAKSSTAARQHLSGKQDGVDSSPEREHNPASEVIVDLSTRLVGRQGMVLEVGKDGSMVSVVVF